MTKIFFQDLTALMREHGEVNDRDFQIEETEIRRDDRTTTPGGYSKLNNPQYQVAFFSSVKHNKIYINIDKIIGKTQFSVTTYAKDTPLGKVSRRLLTENELDFIEEDGSYRVGKNYRGEFRAMDDYDTPHQIQNTEELKSTLEKVIEIQLKLANLEKKFEEQIYNMVE